MVLTGGKNITNFIRCLVIFAFLFSIISSFTYAIGQFEVEWNVTFGGFANDSGYSVQPTLDGGYILGGNTDPYGDNSIYFWILKTDYLGNVLWNKTYGLTTKNNIASVKQTNDGGYLVSGSSVFWQTPYYEGIQLIKTDSNGNLIWNLSILGGNFGEFSITAIDAVLLPSGGYVVGATNPNSGSPLQLIKVSSTGILEWTKNISDTFTTKTKVFRQTSDGGYIFGGRRGLVVKTDSDGNLLWKKILPGEQSTDFIHSILELSDGYLISSSSPVNPSGIDEVLMRTDAQGNLIWSKNFSDSGNEVIYSMQPTPDGKYLLIGGTSSYSSGSDDIWLMKIDSNGNQDWNGSLFGK